MSFLWHWLWDCKNNILKNERKYLMELFRNILYTPNELAGTEEYFTLLHDPCASKYENYISHVEMLWERRIKWAICYRAGTSFKGHNTNNMVESSIRIFKDIV
ncbi:hypothetical protein X975_16842, partial [Stegodyphus mimosarum]